MSASHTPGRLKTRKGFHTDTIEIFKPDRSIKKPFYATELATVNAEDKEGKANARRLVAAWNACEGISTDELETTGGAAVGWTRTASKLIHATTQRDELLAALKHIASHGNKMDFDAVAYARAAIAKAGGDV